VASPHISGKFSDRATGRPCRPLAGAARRGDSLRRRRAAAAASEPSARKSVELSSVNCRQSKRNFRSPKQRQMRRERTTSLRPAIGLSLATCGIGAQLTLLGLSRILLISVRRKYPKIARFWLKLFSRASSDPKWGTFDSAKHHKRQRHKR